jgi:protocatechuate 3,4-dioxygenase beta subunit
MLSSPTRRDALFGASALLLTAAQAQAAAPLRATPAQTEGPFYPDRMPADTDPDLVRIAGKMRDAGGEILDLTGRVVGLDGRPIAGAKVEIWQVDANGRYIHSADASRGGSDPLFQGFGRTTVDGQGGYGFRTIKPVPYGLRTPHIHYKVYRPDGRVLTTQLMLAGEGLNDRDGVYRRLSSAERSLVLVELSKSSRAGYDWATRFDVVVG